MKFGPLTTKPPLKNKGGEDISIFAALRPECDLIACHLVTLLFNLL
jgi:hypothetical protein